MNEDSFSTSSEPQPITFRTSILGSGRTAAGIVVPDDVVEKLGTSKRPPVRVTINGFTYRNTVARRGGRFMVGVSAENRQQADVTAGDDVEVTLENDNEPRMVSAPPDFTDALAAQPKRVADFYDSLSYSQKQWYVLPIEDAKTTDTRQRRVARAMGMLAEGRKR